MFSIRHFALAAGISAVFCTAVVLIMPKEDPRKLAIGEWRGNNSPLQAEVSEDTVRWYAGRSRGHFSYTWHQTDKSPYRVRFQRGKMDIEADIVFNGENEVEVSPLIFDKLPDEAKSYFRERNKALGRPENEIKLVFHRLKDKKDKR